MAITCDIHEHIDPSNGQITGRTVQVNVTAPVPRGASFRIEDDASVEDAIAAVSAAMGASVTARDRDRLREVARDPSTADRVVRPDRRRA